MQDTGRGMGKGVVRGTGRGMLREQLARLTGMEMPEAVPACGNSQRWKPAALPCAQKPAQLSIAWFRMAVYCVFVQSLQGIGRK